MAQTQEAGDGPAALPRNDPSISPEGDVCVISNLPPELLSRVFELGAPDDDERNKRNSVTSSPHPRQALSRPFELFSKRDGRDSGASYSPPWLPFPVLVSRVCSAWRDVALSTPSLWTTIIVGLDARPPYERVSILLERSKNLPIDVSINYPTFYKTHFAFVPSDADLRLLFSLLTPHIHRWRTMEITVSEYHYMHVFLSAVSDPSIRAASQLRALELYCLGDLDIFDDFNHPSMSKHFSLFGGSAPMLAKLVLWGVHVDWNQPWIASAPNLTVLDLGFHSDNVRPSWAQFETILRRASSLRKLSLQHSGPSGDGFTEQSPGVLARLPRITDFLFTSHLSEYSVRLVHKFSFPALKSLILELAGQNHTEFFHELAGLATSSASQEPPRNLLSGLESLEIVELFCNDECIPMLFSELQNLRSLCVRVTHVPSCFLDILCAPCTLPGRGSVWLPRLDTLYLTGISVTSQTLLEVVQKRRDLGAPLSSLYVEKGLRLGKGDVEWLMVNLKTLDWFQCFYRRAMMRARRQLT